MVPGRLAWALLVLAVGLVAVVFIGTSVAGCLGPLGVTGIQCAKATGIFPSVGLGTPVLAGAVLLAAAVGIRGLVTPAPERLAAMAAGAAIFTGAYLGLRPTTWTGDTSTGESITLQLPLDVGALLSAALLGAATGLIVAWLLARPGVTRHGRGRTPRGPA